MKWENHHNRKSHFKVQVRLHSFFEIDNSFIVLFVFDGRFKKNIRFLFEAGFFFRTLTFPSSYLVIPFLDKLLPFLQIKQSVKNKKQRTNRQEDSVFHGDFLPDHLIQPVWDIKRIQENIPHRPVENS